MIIKVPEKKIETTNRKYVYRSGWAGIKDMREYATQISKNTFQKERLSWAKSKR